MTVTGDWVELAAVLLLPKLPDEGNDTGAVPGAPVVKEVRGSVTVVAFAGTTEPCP